MSSLVTVPPDEPPSLSISGTRYAITLISSRSLMSFGLSSVNLSKKVILSGDTETPETTDV